MHIRCTNMGNFITCEWQWSACGIYRCEHANAHAHSIARVMWNCTHCIAHAHNCCSISFFSSNVFSCKQMKLKLIKITQNCLNVLVYCLMLRSSSRWPADWPTSRLVMAWSTSKLNVTTLLRQSVKMHLCHLRRDNEDEKKWGKRMDDRRNL